jgi:transposase
VAAGLLPGPRTPALHPLGSDLASIGRFVDRVGRRGHVRCCYEAGPCGFEWQRDLQARGIPCDVIAPALIPRRPGDRIKTDRRDAGQLAGLYRAGALTAIHIPTEQEAAARELLRCREDIKADLLRARHRLSRFLLRHGRRLIRRTTPIGAPSTKRGRDSAASKRICACCSPSSHCDHASSGCGVVGASMI